MDKEFSPRCSTVTLTHRYNRAPGSSAVCIFQLSLAASGTYVLNDLLDVESDRHHPQKRQRPIAAGDLSPATSVAATALFLGFAFAIIRFLPVKFGVWLLVYVVSSVAYSTWLKRVPIVDVLVFSGLYTLRLLAGSSATGSHISPWPGGFSVFLFFSLAIAKRFAELENLRAANSVPRNGRGYILADIEQLRALGTRKRLRFGGHLCQLHQRQ